MIKKKGEKRNRASGKKTGVALDKMTRYKTDPKRTVYYNEEAHANPTNRAWTGLQTGLGDQVNDIFGAQTKRLMAISQKMAAISSDLIPNMELNDPSNDIIIRISKTWERYQPQMNDLLKNLLNTGNGNFEDLNKRWTDMSSSMQKALSSLGTAQDMPKAQLELLDVWIKLSREMSSRISGGVRTGSTELAQLRDTWSSLIKDMNTLAIELQGQSPWMNETVERMRLSSQEMNSELMDYVEDSYGHMLKLQSMWMTRMSEMSLGFMNAITSSNASFSNSRTGCKNHSNGHRVV